MVCPASYPCMISFALRFSPVAVPHAGAHRTVVTIVRTRSSIRPRRTGRTRQRRTVPALVSAPTLALAVLVAVSMVGALMVALAVYKHTRACEDEQYHRPPHTTQYSVVPVERVEAVFSTMWTMPNPTALDRAGVLLCTLQARSCDRSLCLALPEPRRNTQRCSCAVENKKSSLGKDSRRPVFCLDASRSTFPLVYYIHDFHAVSQAVKP